MSENNENDLQQEQSGFIKTMGLLPHPLLTKFVKYVFCAIAFFVIVLILIFLTKEVQYLWGLLFPLYFGYMAMSLVWDWAEQKIICRSMICVKATKKHGDRMLLILRDADAPSDDVDAIHKFHIPATKQDISTITEDTILTVYYNPRNLGELIAWEITGNK